MMTEWDLSLAPIDAGFDPRVHGMICTVPSTATCVRYEAKGELRVAMGTIAEITRELRKAGYRISVQR
jgi:hypothetical protein